MALLAGVPRNMRPLWKEIQLGRQVPRYGKKGIGSGADHNRRPAAADVQRGAGGGKPDEVERSVPQGWSDARYRALPADGIPFMRLTVLF